MTTTPLLDSPTDALHTDEGARAQPAFISLPRVRSADEAELRIPVTIPEMAFLKANSITARTVADALCAGLEVSATEVLRRQAITYRARAMVVAATFNKTGLEAPTSAYTSIGHMGSDDPRLVRGASRLQKQLGHLPADDEVRKSVDTLMRSMVDNSLRRLDGGQLFVFVPGAVDNRIRELANDLSVSLRKVRRLLLAEVVTRDIVRAENTDVLANPFESARPGGPLSMPGVAGYKRMDDALTAHAFKALSASDSWDADSIIEFAEHLNGVRDGSVDWN